MDEETRTLLIDRLDVLKAVHSARERLSEVVSVIEESESDAAARELLQSLLGCSEEGAGAVLSTQLRRFRRNPVDVLALEVAELEQQTEFHNLGE